MKLDRAHRQREEALRIALGRTPEQWSPVRHRAREVFDGLAVDGKRVLDVGAGIGTYSLYLTRVLGAAEAVALEPSTGTGGHADIMPRMRARLDAAGDGRVRPVQQTFQAYAPGAPFDAVVLLNSINHLHETRAPLERHPAALDAYRHAFARLHDWLAPGGALLINELHRVCLERYTSKVGLPRLFTRKIDYDLHQTPETWARLAREAGFGDIRVRGVTPRRLAFLPSAVGRHRWTSMATNAMFVMQATRR